MIFITLGSQKFQFNRLLQAVDELIEKCVINDTVFAQVGYSDYKPKHFEYKQFLDREEFAAQEAKCDILITHGGTGAIIGAVKKGKKVIAVPRLAKYGEHVDNHQIQLIAQFKGQNLICGLDDVTELESGLEFVKKHEFDTYKSNTRTIIESIERYIDGQELIKVLMIGNDSSVKGGITSVITQLLAHDWNAEGIDMKFIPSYIEANNVKKILFFLKAFRKIKKEFKKNKPDIVHIHMSYKGSFTRKFLLHKLCRKNGIPDIIHLHGSEFKKWFDESDDKKKEQIRILLKECAGFIVLGDKWNKAVKEIEPETKTVMVRNTVHIPCCTVHWQQPFTVLFMGVLIKRKGVADLINAVNLLKKENKLNNVKVIIAGSGAEETELKAMCTQLGLEQYIEFTGWIAGEDKEKIFRESQMLVLPSYNEGLPIAIIEAISYGMPVVATNVGDISSAVIHGENGFLIDPGDVKGLAYSIHKLISEKDFWEKESERAREISISQFDEAVFFETISNLYRKMG